MTKIVINGKYTDGVIMTQDVEEEALVQVRTLCDQPFMKDAHPVWMPDIHAGKGCTIGTTFHMNEETGVCPNLVGVDIACGMYAVNLGQFDMPYEEFDHIVAESVPMGQEVNESEVEFPLEQLHCSKHIGDLSYYRRSIGSLGGGNHFVELDRDENTGDIWLIIHSGSRNLGVKVCDYYMKRAAASMPAGEDDVKRRVSDRIKELKAAGETEKISAEIMRIKEEAKALQRAENAELALVKGEDFRHYMDDCRILNEYARRNRETMAERILQAMGDSVHNHESFHTTHNYIDPDQMIVRKGAIDCSKGKRVLIPLSMGAGVILAVGKGNPEWNCSGPHGAGRKMSRTKAMQTLDLDEYRKVMQEAGVWSSTVNSGTIDESPMAYKDPEEIEQLVKDTVDIISVMRPVYNRKATQ